MDLPAIAERWQASKARQAGDQDGCRERNEEKTGCGNRESGSRLNALIKGIKKQVELGRHRFTLHGFERCVERHISPDEVKNVILSGEIIEHYPEDKYGPS
jgi:hypothetical protein